MKKLLGLYIYLNLSSEGEIIGSEKSESGFGWRVGNLGKYDHVSAEKTSMNDRKIFEKIYDLVDAVDGL